MKYVYILFILLLGGADSVYTSNDNYPFGGRAAGMGNAAVTLYDFWAVSHNQAGLARLEHGAAGVYFENRFQIKELSFGAVAVAYPSLSGVLAVNFTYFGFELYNETKIGLAYARDFGERFSAGVQLNYHHTHIGEDYGSQGNLTFEAGIIFAITQELSIGTHLFNPARAKIGDFADERIPTIFRTGLSYRFSSRVVLVTEIEKSVNHDPAFKAGVEYQISDPIFLRGGIGTNPTTNAFGFGFEWGHVQVDMATSFHHILGYSPQISLIYQFK